MFRRLKRNSKTASETPEDAAVGTMWYKSQDCSSQASVDSDMNSIPRRSSKQNSIPQHRRSGSRSGSVSSFDNHHKPYPVKTNSATIRVEGSFFSLVLEGNQWALATNRLRNEPECARQSDSVTMQGKKTVAYPMHVAVCLSPPISFLETLLNVYSGVTHQRDEICGRLPLHWACLSSASPPCLQLLVNAYPEATRAQDKVHGRTPLHYISMYAKNMTQVAIILNIDPRAVQLKDKKSKTPIDLVQEGTNPLKLDILAALRKSIGEVMASKGSSRKDFSKKGQPASSLDVVHGQWENPGHSIGMNVAKMTTPDTRQTRKMPASPNHTSAKTPQSSRGSKNANQHGSSSNSVGRTDHRRHAEVPDGCGPLAPSSRARPLSPDDTCNSVGGDSCTGVNGSPNGHRYSSPSHRSQGIHHGNHGERNNLKPPPRQIPQPPSSGGFFLDQALVNERASTGIEGKSPIISDAPPPPVAASKRQQTWSSTMNNEERHQHLVDPRHAYANQRTGSAGNLALGSYGTSRGMGSGMVAMGNANWSSNHGDIAQGYQSHDQARQPHHSNTRTSLSDQFSHQMTMAAAKPPPHPPTHPPKQEKEVGMQLIDDMTANIRLLSENLQKQKQSLDEKNAQLLRVDEQLRQMDMQQKNLSSQFDQAEATLIEQQNKVQQKRGRISELSFQIEQLQAEMRREQLQLEKIEPSLMVHQSSAQNTKEQLKIGQDELGSLGAVRSALEEEQSALCRAVANSESELKSLQAIQTLARGENFN